MSTNINNLFFDDAGQAYVQESLKDGDQVLAKVHVKAVLADLPAANLIEDEQLDLTNFPKLTLPNLLFIRWYFALVYQEHKSEAIVLCHKSPDDDHYTIIVPEAYSASAGHVTYNAHITTFCSTCQIGSTADGIETCPHCETATMVPFRFYGSLHSHGSMGAFHSGTDDEHELSQQGFHITVGRVGMESKPVEADKSAMAGFFSICPSFVVAIPGRTTTNGKGDRWYPALEDLIDTSPESMGFTQEQVEMARLWTLRVLSPQLLKEIEVVSPNSVVLTDPSGKEHVRDYSVLYVAQNPEEFEALKRFAAAQPSSRALQTFTISPYLKAIKPTPKVASSYAHGKNTSQRQPYVTSGGALGPQPTTPATTGAAQTTKVVGKVTGPGNPTPSTVVDTGKSPALLGAVGYRAGRVVLSIDDITSLSFHEDHGYIHVHVNDKAVLPAADLIKEPKNFNIKEALAVVFMAEAAKRLDVFSSFYHPESPVVLALDAVAAEILSNLEEVKLDANDCEVLLETKRLENGPCEQDRDSLATEVLEVFDDYLVTDEEMDRFEGIVHGQRSDILACLWIAVQASHTLAVTLNASGVYKYKQHQALEVEGKNLVKCWLEEETAPTETDDEGLPYPQLTV
jgi:hypothetical protein